LDSALAYKRHFPAINWLNSYSLYADVIDQYMNSQISPEWSNLRSDAIRLLQEEAELEEIVRLVGQDSLSPGDRLKLEASRSIREDYLQQNSFDEIDTYSSLNKQYKMLSLIMSFYYQGVKGIEHGISFRDLSRLPARDSIARLKRVPEDQVDDTADKIGKALAAEIAGLLPQGVI